MKNLARRSHLFEPGRKIYTAADNGVVHSVLAAEVSDGTETCVNAGSTTWRFFYTRSSPDAIQFAHSLAHGDRHLYARDGVRLDAFGSGSPKKMRMASPTYLSIVPPNWRAIFDISVR